MVTAREESLEAREAELKAKTDRMTADLERLAEERSGTGEVVAAMSAKRADISAKESELAAREAELNRRESQLRREEAEEQTRVPPGGGGPPARRPAPGAGSPRGRDHELRDAVRVTARARRAAREAARARRRSRSPTGCASWTTARPRSRSGWARLEADGELREIKLEQREKTVGDLELRLAKQRDRSLPVRRPAADADGRPRVGLVVEAARERPPLPTQPTAAKPTSSATFREWPGPRSGPL